MMKAPCQGCADRTVKPNCHTTCVKYLAYAEERENIRNIMRQAHETDHLLLLGAQRIKREKFRKRKGQK